MQASTERGTALCTLCYLLLNKRRNELPLHIKVPCVGGQHHSLTAAVNAGLAAVGKSVELVREPQNPYDKNAIECFVNGDGVRFKCGYIAKNFAAGLAPELDKGTQYSVTIELARPNSMMLDIKEIEANA